MGWGTLLVKTGEKAVKTAGKIGLKGMKEGAEGLVSVVTKPLATAGKVTSVAVTGAAAAELGYVGKKSIVDGQSVGATLADQLGGSNFRTFVGNALDMKVDRQEEKLQTIREGVPATAGAENAARVADAGTSLQGLQSGALQLGSAATGNGALGLGKLLGNLSVGDLGGLGIAGLVASALLLFGRHGILGKVAGLLLGISLLNSSSGMHALLSKAPAASLDEQLRQSRGIPGQGLSLGI